MGSEALESVRVAASHAADPRRVADELHAALAAPDIALLIVFCCAECEPEALGPLLLERFGPVAMIGCTTAGEISAAGYSRGSVVGISLSSRDFCCVTASIDGLDRFTMPDGQDLVRRSIARLAETRPPTFEHTFAMVLIDGLSVCEEAVVSSLYSVLGNIPLFGGSAADSLSFGRTQVLHQGDFASDRAVIALVASRDPVRVFKTEHFVSAGEKMVVTEADPSRRIVREINGEPAAEEYARMVGLEACALTPMIFAAHPVVVRVGGMNFVRSIQKVNPDGSLTFFCAIDEGIVLTVAQGRDIAADLQRLFAELREELGPPQLVIGCDCVLRFLELEQTQQLQNVGRIMAENNVAGFATFGEQYGAMHVNQTFTGVAIGRAGPRGV